MFNLRFRLGKLNIFKLYLLFQLLFSVSFSSQAEPNSESSLHQNSLKGQIYYSDNSYILGPGDLLSLKELSRPQDYNQENILVRPDGYASFSGIGEILAGGKTVDELNALITERLSEYLKKPLVSISVVRTKPATIYLSGAVVKPGLFEMATFQGGANTTQVASGRTSFNMHLSNVLANGGGVRLEADLGNIEVRRASNGQVDKVDYWKVLKGEDPSQDLFIQSGDSIHVPFRTPNNRVELTYDDYVALLRSPIGPGGFPVRIMGWVRLPGTYQLEGTSPYLNTAITKAGGFDLGANKHTVAIRRFKSEKEFETLYVAADQKDVMLQPNDVVYVPELKIYKTGRMFEQVTRILSPFTSLTGSAFNSLNTFLLLK